MELLLEVLGSIAVVVAPIVVITAIGFAVWSRFKRQTIGDMLKRHLRPTPLERVSVTARQFPLHMRADLQLAVQDFLHHTTVYRFMGVEMEVGMGGPDFATSGELNCAPPQYEEIDIGEEQPIQALKNGVWLLKWEGAKFAVLYAPVTEFGGCGMAQSVRIQVAVGNEQAGADVTRKFFRHLETSVHNARCYRGKILSLASDNSYYGHASGVKVHRLGKLERGQVILPAKTLELLDRNVVQFAKRRESLSRFQMATKKGLLFYGPPGTGKTHTIRYLAGSLEGHTTLLISAEQVGLLAEYMTLARLLQPSLVVIEDVDLIARERTQNPGAEVLLNKLLNEMDGLKEDCEIMFILTTNRPEDLEAALASRPGRIDQAIEFPLPDPEGRAKLVRLYARGMVVPDELLQNIVARTQNVSASFIKELMPRTAQFHLERDGSQSLQIVDVKNALDEMLFSGGSLNMKLLGAENWTEGDATEQ